MNFKNPSDAIDRNVYNYWHWFREVFLDNLQDIANDLYIVQLTKIIFMRLNTVYRRKWFLFWADVCQSQNLNVAAAREMSASALRVHWNENESGNTTSFVSPWSLAVCLDRARERERERKEKWASQVWIPSIATNPIARWRPQQDEHSSTNSYVKKLICTGVREGWKPLNRDAWNEILYIGRLWARGAFVFVMYRGCGSPAGWGWRVAGKRFQNWTARFMAHSIFRKITICTRTYG